MRRRWGWMLLVLASAMGACGVGVDRLQTCAPGAVQACACGGGLTGRQTCSVDGLGYGACADCGSTSSICAPGQTIACACGNGTMGAQACLADRSGYGPCAPCNSSTPTDVPGVRDAVACSTGRTACSGRCVDTNADPSHCGVCGLACASGERCSMGTCLVQSTPSDVPVVTDRAPACPSGTTTCEGRCVNVASDNTHCGGCGQPCGAGQSCTGGTCTATDPCAASTSCAACTPIPGCGWCGATRRCMAVNTTCRGPAAGTCGTGWACQPTDCPESTACQPCTSNETCPSGTCGVRECDGARACVPLGRPATCLTIGGIACPVVHAYRRCTSDTQCGPRMRCLAVWPGVLDRVCAPSCAAHGECPSPSGGAGVAYCGTTTQTCFLGCTRAGACTADQVLTCRTDARSGQYSYCL